MGNLSHPSYRADIDGLRALAVLSVVGYHIYPNWMPGAGVFHAGFIGVDMFFVISGYLISSIIFDNFKKKSFSLVEFYFRRIRRIFPALILILGASFFIGWYTLLPDEFAQLNKHILGGSTFVSNLVLWGESGYFDISAETKPLLHLWSLGIEEQYYIIWPLLAWLFWNRRFGISVLVVVLFIVSFSLNLATVESDPVGTFYSPITRFWELLIGSLTAWIVLLRRDSQLAGTKPVDISLSASGLLLLLVGFTVITEEHFPGWLALLPTVGTAFLIYAGSSAWPNRVILSNRALVWFGIISFPLYLWHWVILAWFRITTDADHVSTTQRALIVAISIVLAWLTYRFIEIKIRQGGSVYAKGLFAVNIFIVLFVGGLLYFNVPPRHQNSDLGRILQAKSDWHFPGAQLATVIDQGLRYYEGGTSPRRTLYFGDSNMEQYAPRINYLLGSSENSANSATVVGNQKYCKLLFYFVEGSVPPSHCSAAYQKALELMGDDSVKTIVLSGLWHSYEKALSSESSFVESLRRVGKGKTIVIILSMPVGAVLDPNSMYLGSRFGNLTTKNVTNVNFDLKAFQEKRSFVHAQLEKTAASVGGYTIDPIRYLCPSGRCPIFDSNGVPLYKDSEHMTYSYAKDHAIYIDSTLK